MDLNSIHPDFPILRRIIHGQPLIYFDNAATSQKPRQVLEAMSDFYTQSNANIHRGVHTLGDEATRVYEKAREKVKKFIHARKKEEIIFVRNATEGINLVAKTWGEQNICSEDTILLTELEHHSNIVPWMMLGVQKAEDRGQKADLKGRKTKGGFGIDVISASDLRFVRVAENGELDLKDLEDKLKLPKFPKLLSIVHVSNVLGTINPVKEIIKKAKSLNPQIKVLVDAAQSVPHQKVDVQSLGCDFLVFSGHKMLGPMGIGVLYVKEEILKTMPPFLTGGDMIKEVHFDRVIWNDLPYKFEAGTPNVAGAVGLTAAIDYLQSIGMEKIHQHEQELTRYFLEQLQKAGFSFSILDLPSSSRPLTLNLRPSKVNLLGPKDPSKRAGLVAFNIPGIAPHDLAAFLDTQGIAVRSGFHCAQPLHEKLGFPQGSVRVSFYLYNTFEEIDKFMVALKKASQILS